MSDSCAACVTIFFHQSTHPRQISSRVQWKRCRFRVKTPLIWPRRVVQRLPRRGGESAAFCSGTALVLNETVSRQTFLSIKAVEAAAVKVSQKVQNAWTLGSGSVRLWYVIYCCSERHKGFLLTLHIGSKQQSSFLCSKASHTMRKRGWGDNVSLHVSRERWATTWSVWRLKCMMTAWKVGARLGCPLLRHDAVSQDDFNTLKLF